MKLVVISSPDRVKNEIEAIHLLFQNGMECFHLRKPNYCQSEYVTLLKKINPDFHNRIIIHDFFELYNDFNIKGIHHNSRNQLIPTGFQGIKSRSCHSFDEIKAFKDSYDYLFLSPIFDSISKQNYVSSFRAEELAIASRNLIINNKIIALGGINPNHINQIRLWNFGGIAVLGFLWEDYLHTQNMNRLLENFQLLNQSIRFSDNESKTTL